MVKKISINSKKSKRKHRSYKFATLRFEGKVKYDSRLINRVVIIFEADEDEKIVLDDESDEIGLA